jgi:DNA-directed RNA polymerase subunit RPC12/RpoP
LPLASDQVLFMDAVIQCQQCGTRYIGQASLHGQVTCPRCGALASQPRPPEQAPPASNLSTPVKGLYRRVVCTGCGARLVPPRRVPAGQPILCPRCRIIFAAPGALQRDAEQPLDDEGAEDGWEVLPPDPVVVHPPAAEVEPVVVRRRSPRNDREEKHDPVPVRLLRSSGDRQRRKEAFWIAITLGSVCGVGLIGILLLLIFARPSPQETGRSGPPQSGRQRLDTGSGSRE